MLQLIHISQFNVLFDLNGGVRGRDSLPIAMLIFSNICLRFLFSSYCCSADKNDSQQYIRIRMDLRLFHFYSFFSNIFFFLAILYTKFSRLNYLAFY